MFRLLAITLALLAALLAACAANLSPSPSPNRGSRSTPEGRGEEGLAAATVAPSPSPSPSATSAPNPSPTAPPAATPTPGPTPAPLDWTELPVIPALSERAREVLRRGQTAGLNPRAFAKAGDCETMTEWFLEDFDRGARFYSLGPFQALQAVIDYYKGSFGRKTTAARRGFNAASLLTPFWADPEACKPNENPLACELRLTRAAVVLVMVGTNDVPRKSRFEQDLRQVIEFALAQNVLPVLATKADNLEGDHSINAAIGRLGQEYGVPVWNFWRAVQELPFKGLVEDGAHLTFLPNRFDDPNTLKAAWPVRNLTALQVLEVVAAFSK